MTVATLAIADVAPARAATGLPNHFGIGLSAAPDATGLEGWLPQSGVPWDYAYQYLAGGVNTAATWQQWNENATFPLLYAKSASSHGYLPVITYYEMLDSSGPCGGCAENEKDLAHLNSSALMASYFADVVKLFQRLGPRSSDGIQGFGGAAVVHMEPDLSGYAQQAVLDNQNCFGHCTGQGNDPALLRASVKSSGFGDVSAFADTYQGYSQAIAHLRDLYAPNVMLAMHISSFGTIRSVSSPDPDADPATLGSQGGEFANRAGVAQAPAGTSTYELTFSDPDDRDAAFWKAHGRDTWWDQLNVKIPNFKRWEQWIGAITSATRKPMIVWQIPLGNQRYRTMNNSPGHYQDNLAEYFFGHIDELKAVGIVALLFGGGATDTTEYWDAKNDGVTNPQSMCTNDGVSSGQVCNTAESTYPDDDGGFIRLAGTAFYKGGGVTGKSCPGHEGDARAQVSGTEGNDKIVAPAGGIACGLGGNDVISADRGGKNLLEGGAGSDVLCARQNAPDDVLDGGPGIDRARYDNAERPIATERFAPVAMCS